jgi:hypothetical protein
MYLMVSSREIMAAAAWRPFTTATNGHPPDRQPPVKFSLPGAWGR